jgi:hypothetical protein
MELDIKKINKYLQNPKSEFKKFAMGYTKAQKEVIKQFDLNITDTFRHFGSINDIKNLNQFLSNIGDNTTTEIKKMQHIIINIIRRVLKGYKQKHFWIDIRICQPTDLYNTHRWHRDGCFFPNDINNKTSKFITVLQGPGTLLIKSTTKVNQIFDEILKKHSLGMVKEVKTYMTRLQNDLEKIINGGYKG